MKKLILSIFLLLVIPFSVKADVDFDIKHFYIDAHIQENGDMTVKEAIYLDGDFHGYIRDILYRGGTNYDATDIKDIVVQGLKVNDASFDIFENKDLKTFESVAYASNGETAKYIKSLADGGGGYKLKMFYPGNNDMVAFVISYVIKDAAILYEDVGEINWNFIGWGFEDDIEDLQIYVSLPKQDTSDYFRFWASSQTNLVGISETFKEGETILVKTPELDAYDPVTVRLTFDSSILDKTKVLHQSNVKAFDTILDEEMLKAEQANKLREEIKTKYYLGMTITIIFYVALIGTWIFSYLKYDKERKAKFQIKYNREFIDDYNVEVIDYLMKKSITPNALSASIMNLIYKKNIKYTEIENTEAKKDYEFELVTRDKLNETENILVDFLFTKVGHDNKFSLKDLKKYAKSTRTCDTFMTSYTKWKNAVIADGENQQFFEKKTAVVFGVIFVILGFLIQVLNIGLGISSIICYTTGFAGVIFLFYTIFSNKKTEKGIEHYAKWQGFKNFLDDFGTFELKTLPEIELWDRYLVYAIIFGLADKVQKAMNVRIKELDVSNTYYPMFTYNNFYIGNTINNSINSAINSAMATINSQNAASSMSSGGGFGGGFSSGGGFGGGGGGGHGF